MSGAAKNVNFRWTSEFVERVDAARGDVPRSAYVRRALERQMAADDVRAGLDAAAAQPLGLPVQRFAVPPSYVGLGKGPIKPRPKGGKK